MPTTTRADSQAQAEGRFCRLRPRYSLRTLLIAVTAFAIGFPLWCRWPIREAKLEYPRVTKQVGPRFIEVEDKTAPPVSRTVTTWRRHWGKGHVKSGPTTVTYFGERKQVIVTHYDHDELHGPFSQTVQGSSNRTGRYEHGQREGLWVTSALDDGSEAKVPWHLDRVHGEAEHRARDGTITKMLFDCGRITHLNGQPVSSPLLDRIERGEVRYAQLAGDLEGEFYSRFLRPVTLAEWVAYVQDSPYFPLLISPKVLDQSIEFNANECVGTNLQSALVVSTQKVGLDCDYRYGCLWITTKEDAKNWLDPTGVDEIRPRAGSVLSVAWNEPVKIWRFDQPLAEAVSLLCQLNGISFDASRISATPEEPNRFQVQLYLNLNADYRSFRDLLGVLLYTTGCRCKLNGDTLVILPPGTD
jgi:hypothetical protein